MPGAQLNYIFAEIGRNYGRKILKSVRRLVKESFGLTKLYGHLNFNHTCLRDNLLPKSLRFSPPVRTSRGFKLARKHGFECHFSMNKKKVEVRKLTEKLKALFMEDWTILSRYNSQIQDGVKFNIRITHESKLEKLRQPKQM